MTIKEDGTYVNERKEKSYVMSDFEFNRIVPIWQTMLRDSRFSFPKTRKSMEKVRNSNGIDGIRKVFLDSEKARPAGH